MLVLSAILVSLMSSSGWADNAPKAAVPVTPAFHDSLVHLHGGRVEEGYQKLEEIQPQDVSFIPAMLELQKLHYKKQEWEKFFAYAVFYRKKYLASPDQVKLNFKGRFFTLEALALGRHCLWDEALSVVMYAKEVAKLVGSPELEEIEQTLDYLQLLHEFPKTKETAAGKALPSPVSSVLSYWPLNQNLLQAISNPKVLRFKIKSRCQE